MLVFCFCEILNSDGKASSIKRRSAAAITNKSSGSKHKSAPELWRFLRDYHLIKARGYAPVSFGSAIWAFILPRDDAQMDPTAFSSLKS